MPTPLPSLRPLPSRLRPIHCGDSAASATVPEKRNSVLSTLHDTASILQAHTRGTEGIPEHCNSRVMSSEACATGCAVHEPSGWHHRRWGVAAWRYRGLVASCMPLLTRYRSTGNAWQTLLNNAMRFDHVQLQKRYANIWRLPNLPGATVSARGDAHRTGYEAAVSGSNMATTASALTSWYRSLTARRSGCMPAKLLFSGNAGVLMPRQYISDTRWAPGGDAVRVRAGRRGAVVAGAGDRRRSIHMACPTHSAQRCTQY